MMRVHEPGSTKQHSAAIEAASGAPGRDNRFCPTNIRLFVRVRSAPIRNNIVMVLSGSSVPSSWTNTVEILFVKILHFIQSS